MLNHFQKRWYYFDSGLLATHSSAAQFLKIWYQEMSIQGFIPAYFELIDLHSYKKTRAKSKVQRALKNEDIKPFSFIVCMN